MAIDYKSLPVYAQKQRILDTLKDNQVIVVQSPTGSGKTTQLPVILYEAGYAEGGVIAVTQPRRIAALSVSEFISKQLHTRYPGLVGYKMRFEDKTDETTRIKIMTDGILLQEMKLDPWMKKYSVIIVDEAHERSLNIDFVLGLLKRVLQARSDFKVIVSSATMNAESFSNYFGGCPIVTIDTQVFPVTTVYDPPVVAASTAGESAEEALLDKIEETVDRVLDNHEDGDILVFLPGEKVIKDCMQRLYDAPFHTKIHIVPLYGRLPKEEQEKVFDKAPFGKKKVVISTNIAETSVTIDGITTVIDPGLAKLNFYSPRTFTSSLVESPISKASCKQRLGRAGRTRPGTCYRLYTRKDFEARQEYTTEEIYRTDLSEVVLRMSELGITDFDKFDFISPPQHDGLLGAVETLNMLKALESDGSLSKIGKLMVEFPLEPRISRIIVESILYYPDVLEEILTACSFLSAQNPFVLPVGEEMDARKAHHAFNDIQGDFVSYVKLFRTYLSVTNKERFCKNSYLDEKVMAEILNIKLQLEQIISERLQMPITGGGSMDDYLCCIAAGMIQFVCIRDGRESYRSLTADHITIHPGSSMFRTSPLYIVAGEIVRTSRMFAMSVSPLTRNLIHKVDPALEDKLSKMRDRKGRLLKDWPEDNAKDKKERKDKNGKKSEGRNESKNEGKQLRSGKVPEPVSSDALFFGGQQFVFEKVKGRKTAILPLANLQMALRAEQNESTLKQLGSQRATIITRGNYSLMPQEKMDVILTATKALNLNPLEEGAWQRKLNVNVRDEANMQKLVSTIDYIMRVAVAKENTRTLGFVTLYTNGNGSYWYKVSKGFLGAVNENLASLEKLIDDANNSPLDKSEKEKINMIYRLVNSLYEAL